MSKRDSTSAYEAVIQDAEAYAFDFLRDCKSYDPIGNVVTDPRDQQVARERTFRMLQLNWPDQSLHLLREAAGMSVKLKHDTKILKFPAN